MEKIRILLIDDNKDIQLFLSTALSKEFVVLAAFTAEEGIQLAKANQPDLILLDVVLPPKSGFEVCALLKKDPVTFKIPIIFLSAKHSVSDITHGLELGAEDFLSKPFDYQELIARIKVRLKEKYNNQPDVVTFERLKISSTAQQVFYEDKIIQLTSTEYKILKFFFEKKEQTLSREKILSAIQDTKEKNSTQTRTIDVHIQSLRKKIPLLSKHLIAIYGKGYKLG